MQHLFSVEMFNFCPVWVKMLKSCKISARLKVEYFNTRWRLQFIWILWHKMLDQRNIWSQKIDRPSIYYEDKILDFFETPLWRQFFPINKILATPFPLGWGHLCRKWMSPKICRGWNSWDIKCTFWIQTSQCTVSSKKVQRHVS